MPVSHEISALEIQRQLDRILGSKSFESAERLKRFLKFVVQETAEERGHQLKEFVVGEYVFEKGASFDPRNDPIVRVQARRLRTRLTRYYLEEGQSDEILIDLPKGGYAPLIRFRESVKPREAAAPPQLSQSGILVLPYDDLSLDNSMSALCRGIAPEIVNSLLEVRAVSIVASEDIQLPVTQFSTQLKRHLNATMIVKGSVKKTGSRLRITSQLVDAASGNYVWSETKDFGVTDDHFEIEETVAKAIRAQVEAGTSPNGWRMGSRHQPRNLAAYNLYQQGRFHLNQRTESSLRRSVSYYEKAIAEDPKYAQAYAGLADAYTLLGHYGVIAPVEVWTKAPSNAGWAVLLDQNSVEARTALAHVRSTQDWDWRGSEEEFLRALELDPRNSTAHHWYAMSCMAPMGRLEEALEQVQYANALDPVSSIISRDLALVYYYRREFDLALEQCDHTIELNPHFSPAYWSLGLIQEQRGEFDEAAAAFSRALELSPQAPRFKGALGRTLALSGKHDEARQVLAELRELSNQRYVSPFELASIHFALEEQQAGFDWLKKAFKDRCFELVTIKVDPRFDPLKQDPCFIELAGQLGLS